MITDDSGFYLAYGTTGLGFAYRYEPTVSGSGMCIAMNADTPLSSIRYRNVPTSEYDYYTGTTVWTENANDYMQVYVETSEPVITSITPSP